MRPAAALALAAAFLPVACGRKEPGGAPAAVRPAVPRGEPIADRGELKTAIKAVFDGATDRRVDPAQVAAVAASLPAGDSDIDDAALRALWHASIVDPTAAAIADDASLRLARRAGAETLGSLHRLGTLDRGTIAALERMRDGDPDADVRAAAGKALDR